MIYCPLYFWINLWILLLFYKLHLWSFFLEKHEKHNCCNPLKLLPDDFWHLKKCSVLPTVRWEDQYHQNVLENDQTSHVILIKKANEGIYHSNVKSLEMMCQTDVCLSWKALDVKLFQNYPPPQKKENTNKNKKTNITLCGYSWTIRVIDGHLTSKTGGHSLFQVITITQT